MSGCVLVAVVLILPFYVRSAWRDVRQRMNAVKARNHARENWHRQVVNQIQRRDPAFDVNRFVDHFKVAFVHIQQAWMQQNMSSVMHFVTDGIYEKFMVQFAEQQRQGFREQLTQMRDSETRLAWFGASGPFEVLCVAVQASMVDQRVDLKSGRRLQGIATTQSDSPVYWAPQAISDSECLMWLTGVFAEDGRLDAQERQVIAQLAAKNAIADRIVQQWFVEIQDGEFARPAMPGETRQQDWLDQLVGVCLADGALAPDERSVLQQLTRQLGMSRNQLRLLIAKRYVEPRREA